MRPTSIWGVREKPSTVLIAAAVWNIRRHVTGTCEACPSDGDPGSCEVFRCSVRRLIRHAGLPGLYRAV
jgi:hypothetical protein